MGLYSPKFVVGTCGPFQTKMLCSTSYFTDETSLAQKSRLIPALQSKNVLIGAVKSVTKPNCSSRYQERPYYYKKKTRRIYKISITFFIGEGGGLYHWPAFEPSGPSSFQIRPTLISIFCSIKQLGVFLLPSG